MSVRPFASPSVSGTFRKIAIGLIYFIPGIYPYGVSLLAPIHFLVPSLIFGPLVAKYLTENGVSGTSWKNYWPKFFSCLAFTLMGWVSWPLYIFAFLAWFFGPLVAKYVAENGVSQTFWRKNWLNQFLSWRIPTCVAQDCKIEIFIGYFWMRWVVIRAGVYCPHLWA